MQRDEKVSQLFSGSSRSNDQVTALFASRFDLNQSPLPWRLDRSREARNGGSGEIYLPMTRTDIADYIGFSLAAVSRSFRTLAARNLISFRDRRHLLIADHAGLASLIAPQGSE